MLTNVRIKVCNLFAFTDRTVTYSRVSNYFGKEGKNIKLRYQFRTNP